MNLEIPVGFEIPRYLSVSPVAPTVSPLTSPPLSPRPQSEDYDSQATIDEAAVNGEEAPVLQNAPINHPIPQSLNLNDDFDPEMLNALVRSATAETVGQIRSVLIEQLVYDTIVTRQAKSTTIEAFMERRKQLKERKEQRKRYREKNRIDELIEGLEAANERYKSEDEKEKVIKGPRVKITFRGANGKKRRRS
ncbi:hypothetical protein TWF281_010316 [Arthrobotrys megalospora]